MTDIKSLLARMLETGTRQCGLFGAVIGGVFAVLCLTIGVGKALLIAGCCALGAFIGGVKDKKAWIRKVIALIHGAGNDYE